MKPPRFALLCATLTFAEAGAYVLAQQPVSPPPVPSYHSATTTPPLRVITPPVSPAAPSDLTLVSVTSTTATLQWRDNSTNERGFRVERATSATGPWATAGEVGANVTVYTDPGLTPATAYWYQVRALAQFVEVEIGRTTVTTPGASPPCGSNPKVRHHRALHLVPGGNSTAPDARPGVWRCPHLRTRYTPPTLGRIDRTVGANSDRTFSSRLARCGA